MRSLLGIVCALLLTDIAQGESGPLGWGREELREELSSDRPDFTESVMTIESGHMQFELGYTFTKDNEGQDELRQHVVPEALARFGVTEDLELRLTWTGYESTEENGSRTHGVTDSSLGFKKRLVEGGGGIPDISIIGALFIPTGSASISDDTVIPEMKVLWGYGIGVTEISGNLNFTGPMSDDNRYLLVSNSVALGWSLSATVGFYAEYFGLYPADDVPESDEHYLNGGFTWGLTRDLQLDIRAGGGLNGAAADFFSGTGLVVRF